MPARSAAISCTLLGAALAWCGCARGLELRRFPLEPALWVDRGDYRPFEPMPEEYESPWIWDGADQLFFRPASEALEFQRPREAINVNAMDEVPSSSWYENRSTFGPIPIRRFVEGACEGRAPLDPDVPWKIIGAKPDGANPGFMIEDPEGRRYLLKFDSKSQPERTSTAETIGSMLYWAAGYHVPCNRIVAVDRGVLYVGEGATAEVANERVAFRMDMLDPLFEAATQMPDGRYRASASAILDGQALGPWRYSGRRKDDPNDVVPHEDRRELRGSYVLASWILHYDTRDQNTLGVWVESDEGGFMMHHLIDFGDSLGSTWSKDGISRRIGHASYFDVPQILGDFFTLGARRRPWHTNRIGRAGPALGYFDVEHFEADAWKPGYPNPAFDRATERDHAWMARIVANITPAHVRAALAVARIVDPVVREELETILLGRRERILRRWFSRLSPLTWPRLESGPDGTRACVRDLAVATGVVEEWGSRPYWTRSYLRSPAGRVERLERGALSRRRPDRVCVALPSIGGASPAKPAYLIVDLGALDGFDDRETAPLRMHVYQLGAGRYRLAGVERPYDAAPLGFSRSRSTRSWAAPDRSSGR